MKVEVEHSLSSFSPLLLSRLKPTGLNSALIAFAILERQKKCDAISGVNAKCLVCELSE